MRPGSVAEGASAMVCTSRSEEHTSEPQSQSNLVCRLLLEKKKNEYERHIVRLYFFARTHPLWQSTPPLIGHHTLPAHHLGRTGSITHSCLSTTPNSSALRP